MCIIQGKKTQTKLERKTVLLLIFFHLLIFFNSKSRWSEVGWPPRGLLRAAGTRPRQRTIPVPSPVGWCELALVSSYTTTPGSRRGWPRSTGRSQTCEELIRGGGGSWQQYLPPLAPINPPVVRSCSPMSLRRDVPWSWSRKVPSLCHWLLQHHLNEPSHENI